MRQSPSIIPTDGLDRDIYLVLEDPRSGAAWRETDETATDFPTLIDHLLTGQYEHPLRAPDNILVILRRSVIMLKPKQSDIGRKVIYRVHSNAKAEEGVITRFNEKYVFVRFGKEEKSVVTMRDQLEWVTRLNVVGVNQNQCAANGGREVTATRKPRHC